MVGYQYTMNGYKKRKLSNLSAEEKVDVMYDIKIKKDYHENVCARYNINRESIKSLMKSIKKDPNYLRNAAESEASQKMKSQIISQQVDDMIKKNFPINSIKELQDDIKDNTGENIKTKEIKRYFKENKWLKFKKIKKIPLHANSLRNQNMRQQFAIKMLELLTEGKRILTIDESWFGESNYSR